MGGAFYMAIQAQDPWCRSCWWGTYEMLPMNSYHLRRRPIDLIVGKPIPTVGMKARDMDKLARQTRDVIGAMYYARAGVAAPILDDEGSPPPEAREGPANQAQEALPLQPRKSL